MNLQRFLLTVVLAVVPLLATSTPAVAATAQQQTVKKRAVKKAVKKPSKKPTKKAAPKTSRATAAQTAAAAGPSTDVERRLTRAGDYRFSIQHDGLARTYRVHVPARYDPAEPAPLLVALHGGGMDRPGDDGFDGLARESDFHGFIAVYPDGWKAPGKGMRECGCA